MAICYFFHQFLLHFAPEMGVQEEKVKFLLVGHEGMDFPEDGELCLQSCHLLDIFLLLVAVYLCDKEGTSCSTTRMNSAALPFDEEL